MATASDVADPDKPQRTVRFKKRIGGYEVVKAIGQGAMGTVFLAKQITLGRLVALKSIQGHWANKPRAVARFIREAYACAQLTHHNVVQVYDLGCRDGVYFFTMEYVRGGSLADMIKKQKAPNLRAVVNYILQAARGLEFAHRHGMVHRDVKPANLMITQEGVVKVADLGLVKIPQVNEHDESEFTSDGENKVVGKQPPPTGRSGRGDATMTAEESFAQRATDANVTMHGGSLGTAAYMAPEQAYDAKSVDHRADIYSLGCTFFALITGEPPFRGATIDEVLMKHCTERLPRLQQIKPGIPQPIIKVIDKMTEKEPANRPKSLKEVITFLEKLLAADAANANKSQSTAEIGEQLTQLGQQYNAVPRVGLRNMLWVTAPIATVVLPLLLYWVSPAAALGTFLGGAAACLSFAAAKIYYQQTAMTERSRQLLSSVANRTWLQVGLLAAIGLGVLYLTGNFWLGMICGVLGMSVGLGAFFGIDLAIDKRRVDCVEKIRKQLQQFRATGASETAIQKFVVKHLPANWEEAFEALFGFDEKMNFRAARAQQQPLKMRFASWREPLIRWVDGYMQSVDAKKQLEEVRKTEIARLKAEGIRGEEAIKRANDVAQAVIGVTEGNADMSTENDLGQHPALRAAAKRARVKQMLRDARTKKGRPALIKFLRSFDGVLGGLVRVVLGFALAAGGFLWLWQNLAIDDASKLDAQAAASLAQELTQKRLEPLNVPFVGKYFDSPNQLVIGAFLVLTGGFGGTVATLLMLPGSAIAALGTTYLQPFWIPLSIGILLCIVGIRLAAWLDPETL